MKILMVAAENGALPGGKVGGMGDVVRDIPRALAQLGHEVDIIMPGYQRFSLLPGARPIAQVSVFFRGAPQTLQMFDVPTGSTHERVRCRVLEHAEFAAGGQGKIYCDDPPDRPFASDASKFALFCLGVAQSLISGDLEEYDVIHLHDWHSALLAVLLRYHPYYRSMADKHLVYTIHNLSLQGVRPFHGDTSSLHAWLPEMSCNLSEVKDPRYSECINPMRAAIRLCNRVHAVSPTYAGEIQQPTDAARGFVGGEGLEFDLRQAATQGRLKGILNGCEYDAESPPASQPGNFADVIKTIVRQLDLLIASEKHLSSAHYLASKRLEAWSRDATMQRRLLITSVGRLAEQKVRLLRQEMEDGRSALDHLMESLRDKGVLILLGSGDPGYEKFISRAAVEHENLVFLNGYSEALSGELYESGDLFLMPSSFEPCGISQMLAMRSGQPCLVHGVGGLLDTVEDRVTGFVFQGESPQQQAQNMILRLQEILQLRERQPQQWNAIGKAASEKRFLWSDVAGQYVEQLYSH